MRDLTWIKKKSQPEIEDVVQEHARPGAPNGATVVEMFEGSE